ncbi:MAG: hypothetical protein ACLSFT_11300 [Ruminococcus callidus]
MWYSSPWWRRYDIHPPDCSVFVVNVINGVDAFQNVRDRVVQRVFAGFNGKPLVSHVLQRRDLPNNVLCDSFLREMLFWRDRDSRYIR